MDNEGKLIELSTHADEYASQFLTARSTYYIVKVEGKLVEMLANHQSIFLVDAKKGGKHYTLNFNPEKIDQKLSSVLTSMTKSIFDEHGWCIPFRRLE